MRNDLIALQSAVAPVHMRRSGPETRDLTVRSFTVRADSLEEATRSVEAVVATEDPVTVFDMSTWSVIDEVLRMDGAEVPDQVPMLANHDRYSLDSIYGSTRQLRITGAELMGRLYFAEGDADAEKAWNKVRQKHIGDVSAGYRAIEYTDIAAGQSSVVKGKSYTAGQRTLRITTKWQLREVSLVPIGADKRAKIRGDSTDLDSQRENATVNPKLKAFLVSLGLRADATDAQANDFYAKLNQADKARADAAAAAGDPTGQRSDPPPSNPPTQVNVEQIRSEAVEAYKQRVRALTELAGDDVPADVLKRAIDENWNMERASTEFLTAVRGGRGQGGVPERAPAGHSRSHEGDCTALSLGMALMLSRSGDAKLDPITHYARFQDGVYRQVRNPDKDEVLLRAADNAWEFRDMSLVDVCREAVRIDGKRIPTSRSELVRSAVSGGTLSAIFTTNVSAMLMQGYNEATDSTVGWTSEADVPNFQSNERAKMGKFGRLKKHRRGGRAENLDTSDAKEEYKIARYSGKYIVDEMDIIDDRFGAIEQLSPTEIGLAARRLRPNLVYGIVLRNQAMSDGVVLFHATHKNLGSGALNAANLQALLLLLGKQRQGTGKNATPLNLRARFLVVPQDLGFTGDILLTSAQRINTANGDGDKNPLERLGITLVQDDRMGVAGGVDPVDDAAYTGLSTNYLVAARPGEEGAKTIEVGYLRGTARAPQLRSFTLSEGAWGVGWDINHDIGGKALAHEGMAYSPGT